MSVDQMQARPCYVEFREDAVEDRNSTIIAGHACYKSVVMAIVTPPGRGDSVEKVATEWLKQKLDSGDQFAEHYKKCYEAWKEKQEMPVSGTPIKMWPSLSPVQSKQILNANVKTVEDLAAANQQTLQLIGMGAVGLQQRARDWLKTAKDIGGAAEQISALKEQLKTETTRSDDLAKQVAQLQSQVQAILSATGQPPAEPRTMQ